MLKIEGEKLLANVIRGLRCANLKDCRNTSGNDRGVEAFGNDCGENSKVNLSNVINGLRPVNLFEKHFSILRHCRTCSGNLDHRIKSGDDGMKVSAKSDNDSGGEWCKSGNDWCWKRWFNSCYKFVNTPHSALKCHSLPQGARECGRSMIEMLGVLAIIGVLSVGGIAGYSKAMTKFKTNQIIDQVSTIVTNIKSLYAQQKNYEGLDMETAYMLGVFPDELGSYCSLEAFSCASNAFNGAIYINTVSLKGNGIDDGFVIVYEGLPKETCIDLLTNNWGSKSSLIAMYASGSSGTEELMLGAGASCGRDAYGSYKGMCPVTPSEAARECDCDEGNTCVVSWKFE